MTDYLYARSAHADDIWHVIVRIRRTAFGQQRFTVACGHRLLDAPVSADPQERTCRGCANAVNLDLVGDLVLLGPA